MRRGIKTGQIHILSMTEDNSAIYSHATQGGSAVGGTSGADRRICSVIG